MVGRWLDRLRQKARLAHWQAEARRGATLDPAALRQLRADARALRRVLDHVTDMADERLALPAVGSETLRRVPLTDWAWRPRLWRLPLAPQGHAPAPARTVLDGECALFHDCRDSEVMVRQVRNRDPGDLAAFGLRIEALGFDGGFLSLSVRLPPEAIAGLGRGHLIRADLVADSERAQKALVWLNIEHGPNTDRIAAEITLGQGERAAEFDLAHLAFDERRVSKAWVDLFFEAPRMNRVVLRDLTFGRRPRAEL
ncbi:MAG: hypothetical protein JSR87_04455 [Proteobacteria bacterium]|nr:hypothetical protein [Pseudomonadota bacterium]MBS0573341.1 hypothetical protein [Pseudomonadota bacterium]